MNERINGLWWKARIGYNNQNCDPEVLEKFAELIVAECLDIVEDEDDGSADTKSVRWAMIRIKKHFGVEE